MSLISDNENSRPCCPGSRGLLSSPSRERNRDSLAASPAAASDRLYLVNISGTREFRPLYEALTHMAFYNLRTLPLQGQGGPCGARPTSYRGWHGVITK